MLLEFVAVFLFSTLICICILVTKPFHIDRTAKGHTSKAKQSVHRTPTPRIGGLTLVGFFIIGMFVADGDVAFFTALLFTSALPVFLGGFGEDIGFNITPKIRLFLSFASALIACIIFNAWITRTGIPGFDSVLMWPIAGMVFTVILSGGVCHSINLIDGLNGLAIGLCLLMTVALGSIAFLLQDTLVLTTCVLLFGALLGVFMFNFPLGKIFLGDAGAYCTGHLLFWMAVYLVSKHNTLAPFAILLVFFWPIADMLFAIIRRLYIGQPIDQPDRMHFHQFVMRAIELSFVGRRRRISNPLAAAIIWPLAAIPMGVGVYFYTHNFAAACAWLVAFLVFILTYALGMRFAKFLFGIRNHVDGHKSK
ncbi:MAG: glycosyltransferase [Pseudomonadota bacterium]